MSLTLCIEKRLGNFHLDVSMQTSGGILGLLGPSGCGKSKTLQCIAGIERPDRGRVILHGKPLFDAERGINLSVQKRRVGYLFQHYALFPHMTVAENIACGIRGSMSWEEKKEKIRSVLMRLRLTGLEKQKPDELSGGQQQRTALGRILINEPDMLLLDEPFSALDSFLKGQLMEEMKHIIRQFQKDVVVVTHNRDEAYGLCDTIAVMDKGRLEVMGKTEDVFSQPRTRTAAVLLGCQNIENAEKRGIYEVYVPAWNIILRSACPVEDDLCAVGIRSQAFSLQEQANRFAVRAAGIVEKPFVRDVHFRYTAQREHTSPVCMTLPKEQWHRPLQEVGVRPEDILLLYR